MAILDQASLKVLIGGTTHVLDRNGKEAYVYFETGDQAHMLLDDGETRQGTWALAEGGYVVDWDNGAVGRWTLDHEAGSVSYVNRDNDARVRLAGILFGNAKGLPRREN
ncbi:hypothetical protein ACFFTN_10435 [Aminobacter aganoensis]|uniref:Uncharacterized protein n=1 Tax=Aminobacter aganoensis TaxID=83264 RepID=A0A7X0FCG1_9HYPH|nr:MULTISPECIES: hypothetical protein [Aminobacter]KQU66745.1 hypothetical protein ASC75_08990 [Aminobacter sp. DSM 101952]MBB6357189.1 hypothetical protein [Aminobacter aganoensis]